MMNKREFLKGGVAALVAGAGSTVAVAAARPGLHERSGPASWQAHVGQVFRVDGHPVALQAVTTAAGRPQGSGQFSVSFTGHLPAGLGDRMYTLMGDSGEPVQLYLARTSSGLRADFCRHAG